MRGFLSGVIWGGVVSVAGLAVISQVAPLPGQGTATAPATTAPEPEPQPLPKAPEAEVQPEILQKGPDSTEEEGAEAGAPAAGRRPRGCRARGFPPRNGRYQTRRRARTPPPSGRNSRAHKSPARRRP